MNRAAAEFQQRTGHPPRGPDSGPAGPDIERGPGATAHRGQNLPGRLVPDLMAVVAGLHVERELELRLRIGGRLDHIQPPRRRVHLRRRARVGSNGGVEVEPLAGTGGTPHRVFQAVATHEQVVASVRQIGHDIPALVVGHDDAGELRWQVGGLGNHPDTCLRTVRARDDTADVIRVDRHVASLGAQPDACTSQHHRQCHVSQAHGTSPWDETGRHPVPLSGKPTYAPCCGNTRAFTESTKRRVSVGTRR